MNLQIRDPRAHELAKELARIRNVSMTEAVVEALQAEVERERTKVPLALRVTQIARDLRMKGKSGGRDLTKDEIDEMWGHR